MVTMIKRNFGFQRAIQNLLTIDKLEVDKSQEFAIKYLTNLSERVENDSVSSSIWKVSSKNKFGAYIYGSVGSGKTMLMNLFYSNVRVKEKSRFHFNQFMLKFHSDLKNLRADGINYEDPTRQLIRNYCNEMKLLCLDEFQVTDIADAMILRSLLSSFIESGMTIVTTSNRHPDELYLNGIQRSSFLPCIDLIKSSLEVISLSSKIDYRDRRIDNEKTKSRFINPINDETDRIINEKYKELCTVESSTFLEVMGRQIKISNGRLGMCSLFTFSDLFEESKSAADYIKICQSFPKIFITKIPKITAEMRNEIRRFVTFIDQVYELKNEIFLQSEVDIFENLENVKKELSSTFDESFALSRTISRLKELDRMENQ